MIAASLDGPSGTGFGALAGLTLTVTHAEGDELAIFPITDVTSETAFIFGEIFQRSGTWKLRAVGQGYDTGLAGLATDFGISVEESDVDMVEIDTDAIDTIETALSDQSTAHAPADDTEPHVPELTGEAADVALAHAAPSAAWPSVRSVGPSPPASAHPPGPSRPSSRSRSSSGPNGLPRRGHSRSTWPEHVDVPCRDRQRHAAPSTGRGLPRRRESQTFDCVVTLSNDMAPSATEHPATVDKRKLRKVAL